MRTLLLVVSLALAPLAAQGQSFTVLYSFNPNAFNALDGLTMDASGNLYGTTSSGGYRLGECANYTKNGCGTVFKLARYGSHWVFTPLYAFQAYSDGALPYATVVFGPNGALYGTTCCGGGANSGTVFTVTPPSQACKTALCMWDETVIYTFCPSCYNGDGMNPAGAVAFDAAGNIYGTTCNGGKGLLDDGTVYQLTPSGGREWKEAVLYSFNGPAGDGTCPESALVIDQHDNLFGTTAMGAGPPYPNGEVFEVSPVGGGWSYQQIYTFHGDGDGKEPSGSLISDAEGNFYGATVLGYGNHGPTVYDLSPSGGGWTESVLYTWAVGEPGGRGSLTMDSAGNLYGATGMWPSDYGSIFKLTRSNGGWSYSTLHQFTGGSDGAFPNGHLAIDAQGNIYGTTQYGGSSACMNGCGVVFEINQ